MSAQDLTDIQIRLVNIIQDKYEKPLSTEGQNILKNIVEIHAEIYSLWPSEEYAVNDVAAALHYLQFDSIPLTKGGTAWLIKPKA